MTVSVDIADRQYDYTDEDKAAEAIAAFQAETALDDRAVLKLWDDESDPRRADLEARIVTAVDLNGTLKRAAETVPGGISLFIADAEATN